MKSTQTLLAASIAFAMILTFSCSSDDGGGSGKEEKNINPSSSSVDGSLTVRYGSFSYEGKTYKTVVIGDQIWMAENLNIKVDGSKCYDNDDADCAIYGRLYEWTAAMDLDASCNNSSCSLQPKHQGICPDGWHIPSLSDWSDLERYVGGSSYAGKYLKATSGWNNDFSSSGNGVDTYGFTALPGGHGYSEGSFNGIGRYGRWWTTFNSDEYGYYRDMRNSDSSSRLFLQEKNNFSSVRCLKSSYDENSDDYSPSINPSSSSSIDIPIVSNCNELTFESVMIDGKTWMAENLNCNISGSKCYSDNEINCRKYGRLYDWATAMNLETFCNSIYCSVQSKHQGICPDGWHMPTIEDWDKLLRHIDFDDGTYSPYSSDTAGRYLKATSGWGTPDFNGEDTYGFKALPGGYSNNRYYSGDGINGYWWTASEYGDGYGDGNIAYSRTMIDRSDDVHSDAHNKSYLLSVRCVKD